MTQLLHHASFALLGVLMMSNVLAGAFSASTNVVAQKQQVSAKWVNANNRHTRTTWQTTEFLIEYDPSNAKHDEILRSKWVNANNRRTRELPWQIRGSLTEKDHSKATHARPDHANWAVAASIRGGQLSDDGATLLNWASSLASLYGYWLATYPILTKSVTASLSFGLADMLAQTLTRGTGGGISTSTDSSAGLKKPLDTSRITWAMLVGLLYYGPAAHVWYEGIFHVFPGTSFGSTLLKAAVGQISFSPGFTCIFFATTLIRSGQWSLVNWFRKIVKDLPQASLAGIGFWPIMDVVGYTFMKKEYIPLFNTICSFVWTIYLSLVANRLKQQQSA